MVRGLSSFRDPNEHVVVMSKVDVEPSCPLKTAPKNLTKSTSNDVINMSVWNDRRLLKHLAAIKNSVAEVLLYGYPWRRHNAQINQSQCVDMRSHHKLSNARNIRIFNPQVVCLREYFSRES